MRMNIGLLGCAHIHTPDFVKRLKARKDVTVKSVWDHESARGQKNADDLGARFLGDARAILDDPEVKAVIICSETNRHQELAIPAARATKHLFIEKPIGVGARDANAIADAVEQAGVIFQTGYATRSFPPVLFLRELVQTNAFGKVTRARASVCHSGALGGWFDKEWRWMADPKQAGVGAFGDLGTHGLDILLWLFGPVDSVTGTLDNGTARYPNCDETGEAIIRFKSGMIATLAAAWDDVANPVSYQISGTEGHAMILNDEVYFKSEKVKGAEGKSSVKDLPKGRPHAFELFLDALSGQDVPLVGVREAAYRCTVMEAIYHAAANRAWVAV
jgi:predicted dehydrogenase